MSDSRIDPRAEALGVYITNTPNAKYQIVSVGYQDQNQSQGNHNIYYTVLGADGKPMVSVPVYMDWNGRIPKDDDPTKVFTDPKGQANIGMYANLDVTLKNGPYFAFVEATVVKGVVSDIHSDIVHGMGLPEHRHVNFLLLYQVGGVVPPPPQTGHWVLGTPNYHDAPGLQWVADEG